MRRICIYLTYDKQNVVDGYIGYMLKELKTCVDYLTVVCNERYVEKGLDFLEMYADEIFYRENVGFDAGGFKDALCNFIGWKKLSDYDELLLVNDSFFGPFRSMTEIFEEMDKKRVDFWGLSKHGEWEEDGCVFPEHLQSFFLAIRSSLLHDSNFRQYWEDMPYYKTLLEVVYRHEVRFTSYFSDLGFTYDCLADMEPNDSKVKANNFIQYARLSYELIKKRNFPFLKKQPFVFDTTYCQTQENLRLSLDYIDKETPYDSELIWDNLLRTFPLSDLQRSLHLQYNISQCPKTVKGNQNIVIVAEIDYVQSKEMVIEYLEPLKELYTIKIIPSTTGILNLYKDYGFEACILSDFAVEIKDSDLICLLHDTDITGDRDPSCVGKSYFFNIWENVLKNHSHIQGVVELFEKERRLGILAPPRASFGKFFRQIGMSWGNDFEKIRKVTEKLQLKCPIIKEKRPMMDTDSFWIRGKILKQAVEEARDGKDWRMVSQVLCYIAQDMGYYSGIIESTDYASISVVNFQYYLSRIGDLVRYKIGDFSDFRELYKQILRGAINTFCYKVELVYIYGTGKTAKMYQELIPRFDGYIISDGQIKEECINHKTVFYLSEIDAKDNIGIIVCLGKNNQAQVIPLLKEKGWKHYLCV